MINIDPDSEQERQECRAEVYDEILRKRAPSAEAISLAVKLSGHNQCASYLKPGHGSQPCDGCLGDAATIDRELCLPQKHAALFAAQHVMDIERRQNDWLGLRDALRELRDALAAIKATR